MLNRVVITGRLTRDPELRYTGSGVAVCSFTVAVDRQFRNQQGDRDADFISCVIWRKSAENFANFTHKGSLVGIDGRLSTRNYENNQGQRVYVTEVTVDNFALLEPRANGRNGGAQGGYNNQNQGYQQNNAFNQGPQAAPNSAPQQQTNNQQPVFNQGNQVDLSTLPFTNDNAQQSQAPASSADGINIDDQSAMGTNHGSSSSDNDSDQPSIDDVPF
jgi:single-strand DNA-binding protein